MPPHPLLRISVALTLCSVLNGHAAVKLLTGDANNQVHASSATLQDISSNGDYVLFTSGPPVSGSTPGISQGGFYVRKVSTNSLTFVGDSSVPGGPEGSFSDDGRYLTWRGTDDFIYWRDSASDVTRLITPAADGASRRPVMSADGRYVAYASVARNIVSNSSRLQASGRAGVYLYDSVNQTTTVVSLTKSGAALSTGIGSAAAVANAGNEFDFSANGKYLVFSSDATNVHSDRPANYPAGFLCVYRRNLGSGAVDVLNKNSSGKVSDGNFYSPRISANGARVVFFGAFSGLYQGSRMMSGVNNTLGTDIYVKDASSAEVWWATRTLDKTNADGVLGVFLAMSGDGETVAFPSTGTKFVTEATDPAVGNSGQFDLFRVDLLPGASSKTSLVTKSPNNSGNVDFRVGPLIAGNGDYVAFSTSQVEAMLGTGSQDTINFQGFGVTGPKLPLIAEISVQQPAGSELADGSAKKNFGTMKIGKTSTARTFVIRNAGTATLKSLAVKKSGTHKNDFTVTALAKTALSPGASTTFKVTFKPSAKGTRNALLQISSNDANENPFDIKLTGLGSTQ